MDMKRQRTKQCDGSGETNCNNVIKETNNDDLNEEKEVRDWSSLTEPLLLDVVKRLETLQDNSAFRSVCQNWRSLSHWTPFSMSSQSPLIILECSNGKTGHKKVFYDISKKCLYKTPLPWGIRTRHILGYSHGHIFAGTRCNNQKILLCNLFSGARTSLPQIDIDYFPKFIMSSSPSSPGCMVILRKMSLQDCPSGCIYYCHLGDQQWRKHSWKPPGIADMIFLHGRLYALSRSGRLGVVNFVPDPELSLLEGETGATLDMNNHRWLLAELGGELLVICVNGYNLWRWDFERGGGFAKVTNLHGGALFIARNSSFAGSIPAVISGVRKNCIYRIDSWKNGWSEYMLDDGSANVVIPTSPGLFYRAREPPVWIFPSLC